MFLDIGKMMQNFKMYILKFQIIVHWVHTVAGLENSMENYASIFLDMVDNKCSKGLRTMYLDVASNCTFGSGVTIEWLDFPPRHLKKHASMLLDIADIVAKLLRTVYFEVFTYFDSSITIRLLENQMPRSEGSGILGYWGHCTKTFKNGLFRNFKQRYVWSWSDYRMVYRNIKYHGPWVWQCPRISKN